MKNGQTLAGYGDDALIESCERRWSQPVSEIRIAGKSLRLSPRLCAGEAPLVCLRALMRCGLQIPTLQKDPRWPRKDVLSPCPFCVRRARRGQTVPPA